MVVDIKQWLSMNFKIKNMGETRFVLGIKIVKGTFKLTSWFVTRGLH